MASLICLAASPAWAAAEASYAGALAAEFFGPFGFAAGSGIVSCVSGHCRLQCLGATACSTDPPATGPAAPFGGAVLLDAAVDVVKTERGFTADFHITSENNTGPNGSTQGLDWGSNGLTVEVYAPLAAGAQVLATTVYDLGSSWTNAEKGARVGLSFEERCRPGGASVSNAGSGSGSKSAADTVACVLAVDGTKTLATPAGTFRLVQRVTFGMSAGMRFNDQMTSGGRGSIVFGFKAKGKELAVVGGPPEGLAGVDPSFPRPFVVKVVQNDTGAAVAGEPVVFQLKDLAGNAVGAVPTATAGTLADGTAAVNFKVAGPGDYKVEASCAGCVEGSPQVFGVSVKAVETHLEKVEGAEGGDRQHDKVAVDLPIPLRARVRKTDGASVRDAGVQFSQLSGPGNLQFSNPSAMTDPNGVAASRLSGNAPGVYEILAFCPSCTGPVGGFGVAAVLAGSGSGTDYREQRYTVTLDNKGAVARAKVRPPQTATPSKCGATLQMRDPFINGERVPFADGDTIPWCIGSELHFIPASDQANANDVILMEDWQLQQALPDPSPLPAFDDGYVDFANRSATDLGVIAKRQVLFAVGAGVRIGARSCRTTPRRVLAQSLGIGGLSTDPSEVATNLQPGRLFSLAISFPGVNTNLFTPTEMRRFIQVRAIDVLAPGGPDFERPSIWVREIRNTETWMGQKLLLQFESLPDRTAAPLRVDIDVASNCPGASKRIELKVKGP